MDKVQDFFQIVPWTLIFQYCNLLILCLLFKKFLFKPVQAILKKRQDEIDGIYDAANQDREQAAALKQDYDKHMQGARAEADQLIREAVDSANRRGNAIVDEARAQAGNMIARAETEIERDRAQMLSDVRKELGGMAVDIASQMVNREISAADQDSLVDDFIRNAGDRT